MRIVVLGGGTAGWLTALYAQRTHPQHDITLIESEQIGVLGAGEGSTPSLPSLLNILGIDVRDLFTHTGATVKNGIRFTGWNPDRDFYYPFPSYAGLGTRGFTFPRGLSIASNPAPTFAARAGVDLDGYDMVWKMSEAGLVPMYDKGFTEATDVLPGVGILSDWGIHFNAREIAKYLRGVAEERGVTRVEGIVSGLDTSQEGDVTALLIGDHRVPADFVFDCSGFARQIIGKHYGATWVSHREALPASRALPFFLPMTEDIPPYTESVAMDYGWMWRIPLQERFGCGYVFDSDYLTDDQAKAEVEAKLGYEVFPPTVFPFNAGCYETPWIRNVAAIGLSAGFLEPLEATAIWQVTRCLQRILGDPGAMTSRSQETRDRFNEVYMRETRKIVAFLHLHYLTKRKGEWWEGFAERTVTPPRVRDMISVLRERPLYDEIDFDCTLAFNAGDFTTIIVGNGLIDPALLAAHQIPEPDINGDVFESMMASQDSALSMLWSQREFLKVVTA